ncbi:MAG: hypothetical protein KH347_03670 [Acetobacter sp.]|nr:hypothetical protein [Acetobacter sp.]
MQNKTRYYSIIVIPLFFAYFENTRNVVKKNLVCFAADFLKRGEVFYEIVKIRSGHIVRTLQIGFNQMFAGEFDVVFPARRGGRHHY